MFKVHQSNHDTIDSKSGTYSKNKGRRFEQEVVNLLKKHGIDAYRVSRLETGRISKGDVDIKGVGAVEVKGGAQVPKFLYTARKEEDHILVMRRDRKKWVMCMDLEQFIEKFLK